MHFMTANMVHGGPRDPAAVHHPWTQSTGFPLLK
jgi:hypothetical protein